MGTAIATFDPTELVGINAQRIAAACPAHFTPAKVAQMLSLLAHKNPDLRKCVPESVIVSVIQAGELGLSLNPSAAEAYLIPRWNKNLNNKSGGYECQLQIGYKGLEKLAIGTGAVRFIEVHEVIEGDEFRVVRDTGEKQATRVVHAPNYTDRGRFNKPILYYYTLAHMADGQRVVEVMSAEEVEDIHRRTDGYRKAQSNGWNESGPWATDYVEMAKKTVVRRATKRLPRSGASPAAAVAFEKLDKALELDNREFDDWREAARTPEHHAINHDNGTGHGSGAYAPPEVVAEYSAWVRDYCAEINAKWADEIQRRGLEIEQLPKECQELLNTWQLTGHLLKWALAEELINAPLDAKSRQRDPFVAVAWMRHRDQVTEEGRRYARKVWADKRAKLPAPPPEPEDVSQVTTSDDSDPDCDYPDEPGANG